MWISKSPGTNLTREGSNVLTAHPGVSNGQESLDYSDSIPRG
jgi:hypothetical protein